MKNKHRRGFTLIEIMVVVVILGLLATLVGPRIWSMLFAGQQKIALAQCKQYYDDAKIWKLHKKKYPSSLEEMEAPLTDGDDEPFIEVVDDPWGNPYYLEQEGKRIRVWSWGPDGQEQTDDDIVYPERKDE